MTTTLRRQRSQVRILSGAPKPQDSKHRLFGEVALLQVVRQNAALEPVKFLRCLLPKLVQSVGSACAKSAEIVL